MSTKNHVADSVVDEKALGSVAKEVAEKLRQIKARHLAVRLAEFPVRVLAVLPALWLVQAGIDWLLNLPWTVRLVLLIADLGLVALLVLRHVLTPWKTRIGIRAAALLVEREVPEFRTGLISCVDFARNPPGAHCSSLVHLLTDNVSRLMAKVVEPKSIVPAAKVWKIARWAVISLIVSLGLFLYCQPKSVVLLKRLLLSSVALPSKTTLTAISTDLRVASGSNVELSVRAEGELPPSGILKLIRPDKTSEEIAVSPSPQSPNVYRAVVKNVRAPFSYSIRVNDGTSEVYQVSIRVVPSLNTIRFTQKFPDYLEMQPTEMAAGNLVLFAGGKLLLEAEASEPLESVVVKLNGVDGEIPAKVQGTKITLELPIPEDGLKALSLHLKGSSGEESIDDPSYRVRLTRDQPPIATLKSPKQEKITVIPSATVPISFSARDDFGLSHVSLCYQTFRPDKDGSQTPAESGSIPVPPPLDRSVERSLNWAPSSLAPPLAVGSAVAIWIEVKDKRPNSLPVKSVEKTIQIVSEEQKTEELMDSLAEKAEKIQRLYEEQQKINQKTNAPLRSP